MTTSTQAVRQIVLRRSVVIAAAVAVVAFLVRAIGLSTANELFIDELTYTRLAVAVGDGDLPNLAGALFFLHPPGSFVVNGLVIDLFGLSGTTMELVYELRWVNAVIGALVVLLGYLIARRVTTPGIAIFVAVVLAFDPFVLRNDTRVMLEAPTTAAMLAGWLVLLAPRPRPVAAGLLFGWAILTKDIALVLVFLPLVLAVVWRQTLTARTALVAGASALMPYTVYLTVLLFTGHLGDFLSAKSLGVRRMAGLVQMTGFNAPEAPSLSSRLVEQVTRFGTSYVLIGLCLFAGIAAALSIHAGQRVVGLVAFTGGVFGAYAVIAGTLEEQFGYYLAVPSVLAFGVLVAENHERRIIRERVVQVVVAIFAALTVVLGVTERLSIDDSYRRARDWLNSNVPPGARVGLTNVTAEFAFLPRLGYGVWPSLHSLADHRADYVLTQSATLSQGYGYASPALLTWLQANAEPVFTSSGPTGGRTIVWRLDEDVVRQAIADGLNRRPVTGPHR